MNVFVVDQILDSSRKPSNFFTKIAYKREDRSRAVVLRYVGDETVAGQYPHGNAKQTAPNYQRTRPNVLAQIRQSPGKSPVMIYESVIREASASGTKTVSATVHNIEQVRNTQKLLRNKDRLSRDSLYNLHELAYDTQFVHYMLTYPDLIVFCYHKDIIETFKT